ncbi:alkaline phosphatase D family protein [Micromonospora sp. WMMD812]|uniref:alkaline phosphatase D family protein n=1 Tax=Micromonospora sp. WMMD812 TaxID=3015152 RepID=UPI00248BE822|nr:alkaline phosphatase D family protein [Micromonospora sp. WMMD812]WBB70743.1 alkaline phosphatase D family protein [Micromonospora sp. WMMD812]
MEMDELESASPAKLAATRRRFLTLTGAAAALAFATRLPGSESASAHGSSPADYPFTLGVASGDPLPDAVVIWTRLAPKPLERFSGMSYRSVQVDWEVADNERFHRPVRRGTALARPEYGHSVHVDVRGLKPGRHYYYRFRVGRHESPVGRTKTAPDPRLQTSAMAFAFVSCQRWDDGFFTAYRHLAAEDLDLVVHLGDYIYEYGIPADGKVRATAVPEPYQSEIDTLDRYRMQYALYKTDPDLQAAHAAFPFAVTWDDHEVENNYADDIPENSVAPADFLIRRANGYRAYWENMPLRPLQQPYGPDMRLYRRLTYGNLAEFNVLDTRQYRSDQPCGGGMHDDCDERFDPSRTFLGTEQERWLLDGLGNSRARWNVLAQQVVMAQLDFNRQAPVNISTDSWDGYVAPRERLLTGIRDRQVSNPVVLTGDVHRNYAFDLKEDFTNPDSTTLGAEFVGTSVTSGGNGQDLPSNGANLLAANPHLRMVNNERGYVRCTLTPQQWRADYRVVPYVTTPGAPVSTRASFVLTDGNPRMEAL